MKEKSIIKKSINKKWPYSFGWAIFFTIFLSRAPAQALDIPGFEPLKPKLPAQAVASPTPFIHGCKIIRPVKPLPAHTKPHPLAGGEPYWRTKKDLYKRMSDEKYIVVSAKNDEEGGLKTLSLLTAGHIFSPIEYTYDQITEFDKFPERVSYIKEAKFDPATSNLFIHGALLGYHIKMVLKIDPFQISPQERVIYWESIQGGLVGMKGDILLKSIDGGKTEISMRGRYAGKTMPIPDVILKWGLELAGQRAAGHMRSSIEDAFKKCR